LRPTPVDLLGIHLKIPPALPLSTICAGQAIVPLAFFAAPIFTPQDFPVGDVPPLRLVPRFLELSPPGVLLVLFCLYSRFLSFLTLPSVFFFFCLSGFSSWLYRPFFLAPFLLSGPGSGNPPFAVRSLHHCGTFMLLNLQGPPGKPFGSP